MAGSLSSRASATAGHLGRLGGRIERRLPGAASYLHYRPSIAVRLCRRSVFKYIRATRIIQAMRTVIETPTFQKQAGKIWSEDEWLEFIVWIAANPVVGDVIPGADGARKVRWSRSGSGKSGGARVIYFNLTEEEVVLLVAIYAKAERSNMTPAEIKKVV